MTVLTDHSAVKSVLEASNPTGKHARWWTRVYGRGIKSITIVHRAGRENVGADALSRSPVSFAPPYGVGQGEVQVSAVTADSDQELSSLLQAAPEPQSTEEQVDYSMEQSRDPELNELISYLNQDVLPDDTERVKKLVAKASQFTLIDGILIYLCRNHEGRRRVVVPVHLRESMLRDSCGGSFGGHFAGPKLYNTLSRKWWWNGMYNDVIVYCRRCPECAIVSGAGRQHRPPLLPILTSRPFQKIGVDVMDLPCTDRSNKHVVVFQDMFTKWPLVFPVPDQRAERIARLLCKEVVPMSGVPEALLSDRGSNLLSSMMLDVDRGSNLLSSMMLDVCKLLGIEKLNTTSYHPECDGMVERFNRTLKTMLRKRAAQYSNQWDRHLPGLLWAYRNVPHDTTGEKPSFLLFGWDCRSPTEAALLPVSVDEPTSIEDYRQELVLTLSSARKTALETIRKAQKQYKASYDHKADNYSYWVGDWVLIRFPSEERGRLRKLSRPWHSPYRVTSCNQTNVTGVKVYFPRENSIQVHQLRVKPCPQDFPAGYYWYGTKPKDPGRPPRWVECMLAGSEQPISHMDQSARAALTPMMNEDTSLTPVPDPASSDSGRPTVGVQLPVVDFHEDPKEIPNDSASPQPDE